MQHTNFIRQVNTPCFVIDSEGLESNLELLKQALNNSWGNYLIGYSYKTNSLPWIIEFYRDHGLYAEVVSDDEYLLAKNVGVKNVIYNGVAKSKETFLDAIRDHQIVNIDSNYEIDWLDELESDEGYGVGIRVNFDLEKMCPGQTQCGDEGERFGFCYENGELERAIEKIRKKGFEIEGLHLHKSSKTRMPDIYVAIANKAVEISRQYNLKPSYIDVGGGFFGGLDTKPQYQQYFDLIVDILKTQFNPKETVLIVEPGMALVGAWVDYISTVLDIKKTLHSTFVVTDGSRIHIDPLMTKNKYFFDIEKQSSSNTTVDKQIVSGFTCMEHDRLFEILGEGELLPGDRIVYHKVGAYTMCLSPLFIKWFPDVYVKRLNCFNKVRNRWTNKEILQGNGLR